METWKPVVGWETFYEVSDLGNVRSASHTILVNDHGRSYYKPIKSKLLKQSKHSAGYPVVRLTTQNGTKLCYVHRLVAEAFIPNPNNYDCINHKDENKQNNVEICKHIKKKSTN